MGRPRKGNIVRLSPKEMSNTKLTTEILGDDANPRLSVRVRAVLQTQTYVRVAEAVLEYYTLAEAFVRQLRMRLQEGLDPLAGMDPIEAAHFATSGECVRVDTPAFVKSGINLGTQY